MISPLTYLASSIFCSSIPILYCMNFKMCAFFTGYSGYIGGLAHRPHSEAVSHTASLRSFAFPFYLVITVSFFFFPVTVFLSLLMFLHVYIYMKFARENTTSIHFQVSYESYAK